MLEDTYRITWSTFGVPLFGSGGPEVDRTRRWPPVRLTGSQRKYVRHLIRRTSRRQRVWVYAIAVEAGRVHMVVRVRERPRVVIGKIKAQVTRAFRSQMNWHARRPVWSSSGSVREIRTKEALERAVALYRLWRDAPAVPLQGE